MLKTSTFNTIVQQLDSLSHQELLEIREKVDALIQRKATFLSFKSGRTYNFSSKSTFFSSGIIPSRSYKASTSIKSFPVSVDCHIYTPNLREEPIINEKDNSLDKVIGLVDEWVADESGYDEEAYPDIEAGLKQNQ
ncbi:MAG: hypothetical protein QNJ63_20875 [Calothrix sp. MO_192.B10]|nr:hypothetical protein [Calothrix sp. MO_192.B10]